MGWMPWVILGKVHLMLDYIPFRLVAINLSVDTKNNIITLVLQKVYTDTWAVDITGGQAVAQQVASKHWLVNYRYVSYALQFWTYAVLKC